MTALNPIPDRGVMVKAGMKHFTGKDARKRSKKKGKEATQKLGNSQLSPSKQFIAVPPHIENLRTLK
jgi:hypothetical protein